VWSLKQKWLKKKIALWTYQGYDLRHAVAIHTTADDETRQVRRLGFRQTVIQFPNGVNFPGSLPSSERTEKKRMIFLSRMHKKKGLVELLGAWAKVKPKDWQCELVYTLNGEEEKAYEIKIKEMVEQLGLADDFIFTGKLLDEEKWNAYLRSDKPFRAGIAVLCDREKLENFRMEQVYLGKSEHIFAVQDMPISDFTYEEPVQGYLTEEFDKSQLPFYGRYFKHSLGKVIQRRAPENRYGGTTPPEADF
jgi:hypothetical protein